MRLLTSNSNGYKTDLRNYTTVLNILLLYVCIILYIVSCCVCSMTEDGVVKASVVYVGSGIL